MKKRTFLFVILIWLIAGLSIFAFSGKAMPLPTYDLYLPIVKTGHISSPEIFIFDTYEPDVIIHFSNVPLEYEGSNGLIWLQRVADPWYQEIELRWITKIGNLGIWRGTIPPVPVSGYYYLKNGLIFYNGYGNPAFIPESDYIWLYSRSK